MSQEHARQFIAAVEQDPALQQTISSFAPATAATDIAKLGAERGLDFSAAEFSETLNSILQAAKGEITEDELDSVAGGTGTHYVRADPNFRIPDGSPYVQTRFWVQHGAMNPGEIRDF